MNYTDEFELFWSKYPARWNHNIHGYVKRKKRPAFEKWVKLSPEIRKECLFKAKYIKAHEGTPRDCITWLNQYGWEDIDMAVPQEVPAIVKTIKLKQVPSLAKESVSNRVNEQRRKLNG